MTNRFDALTRAEIKVLELVEHGLSTQAIAQSMSITVGTVKSHLHRSFEKLDARNRLHAIERARARDYHPSPVETLAQ
jgi:DNA-binding CsgD family transcriptional regulator